MDITKAQFWNTPNTAGVETFSFAELVAALQTAGVGFSERARFHSEVDITATSGSQRTVPWDDIQEDTNNFFDPALTDRMFFRTAGVYIVGYQGQWNNQNAGGNFRNAQIQGSGISGQSAGLLNRANDLRATGTFPLGSVPLQGTVMVTLNADDFIQCRIQQDSGVDLDWQSSGEGLPIMWAQRVG